MKPSRDMSTFGPRVLLTMGNTSARAFAKSAAVSPTALRKYITGTSDPPRKVLIRIARAGNVSVQWLATGDAWSDHFKLDKAPLVRCIESVESGPGARLSAAANAELITRLYELEIQTKGRENASGQASG